MKKLINLFLVASFISLYAVAPAMAASSQAISGIKPVQYYDRDFRGYGPRGYYDQYGGDRWMHHRVRDALARELGPDARRIRVNVENGNVFLSGVVGSPGERRAARDAAFSVPGVRQVFAGDLRAAGPRNGVFGYFPF